MGILGIENNILLVVIFVILVLKIFAFASSLLYSTAAYDAAGKWTKPAWCIVLGLGLAVQLLWGTFSGLLSLAFLIAAIVYLVDVRPALAGVTRRR